MSSRQSLTVYRIRETIQGSVVSDLDDPISDEYLSAPNTQILNSNRRSLGFRSRLFLYARDPKPPAWSSFLRNGFPNLTTNVVDGYGAILMVSVTHRRKERYFAFSFGTGRYLLKPNSYERKYGLRVALNVIFEGDEVGTSDALDRIRRVDSKTVAANTLHTNVQSNRHALFEAFGVDVQQDLVGAVTGTPKRKNVWGSQIAGSDSLRLNVDRTFEQLGDLCKDILKYHGRNDYQLRFSWVDNVKAINDADLIEELRSLIVKKLQDNQLGNFELAPPQLIDWGGMSFQFSFEQSERFDDLTLDDYLSLLESKDLMDDLSYVMLRQRHKVNVVDSAGEVVHSWPVSRCLDVQFKFEDQTYLHVGGDFFAVSSDYLDELDAYIEQLEESTADLPDSPGDPPEGVYNELAANHSDEFLLLDKRTVRVESHTSPIEICDVFTIENEFIHVKRKLGSSSLSHLFAQGSVSGDLFLMNRQFRQRTKAMMEAAESDRADATGDDSFNGYFSDFDIETISPSDYSVTYAIVANWNGRDFVDALPFFSKVNLRRHVDQLRRMGYRVFYKRIDIT